MNPQEFHDFIKQTLHFLDRNPALEQRLLVNAFANAVGHCCEKGKAQGVPVCKDCAEASAAYQTNMTPRAALEERIAGLEADLVEERNRIAAMRVEHGEEVAALTAKAMPLQAPACITNDFDDELFRMCRADDYRGLWTALVRRVIAGGGS